MIKSHTDLYSYYFSCKSLLNKIDGELLIYQRFCVEYNRSCKTTKSTQVKIENHFFLKQVILFIVFSSKQMYLSSLICVVFVGLRIRIDPTQSIRNPFLLQRVSSPNFAHTYSIFDNNFCAISKPFIYLLWTWPYICLIVYVYELIKQKSMKQSSCLCKQPPVFLCGRRQTCVGFLIIVQLN